MAYGYNANQSNMPQVPINPQLLNQNVQPLFPQPQGNVYNINSTLEVANVPVGAGMSIALCLPENVMYIKTMQNGNPLFYPYKIIPFTQEQQNQTQTQKSEERPPDNQGISIDQLAEQVKLCSNKIVNIEQQLDNLKPAKKGSDFDI